MARARAGVGPGIRKETAFCSGPSILCCPSNLAELERSNHFSSRSSRSVAAIHEARCSLLRLGTQRICREDTVAEPLLQTCCTSGTARFGGAAVLGSLNGRELPDSLAVALGP